jgi:DNA-directed RNA polymerase subunit RPC12/RpoP
MSGFSDGTRCPNCGGGADLYTDSKPFSYTAITCYHCGLKIYPTIDYMTLHELNEYRADIDLEPLERLPDQDKSL